MSKKSKLDIAFEMVSDSLKDRIVWLYCRKCGSITKNPRFMIGREFTQRVEVFPSLVSYECAACLNTQRDVLIIDKGRRPPKWWLDYIRESRCND
jgi:hypothetical protein